ncbi:hypothetical protein RAD15_19150 [Bradyrhizobium sp. 14AA]
MQATSQADKIFDIGAGDQGASEREQSFGFPFALILMCSGRRPWVGFMVTKPQAARKARPPSIGEEQIEAATCWRAGELRFAQQRTCLFRRKIDWARIEAAMPATIGSLTDIAAAIVIVTTDMTTTSTWFTMRVEKCFVIS